MSETNLDTLVKTVRILTGEDSTYINGVKVLIKSRSNTLSDGGNDMAANYIKEKLLKYDLEVQDQVFNTNGRNIIGRQTGLEHPDSIYIICAHYDAVTYYCADDNASGVAAVIEAARVLSNRCFDYTILYALWDNEENGGVGSQYYAQLASSNGYKIAGVLNMDMISYDSNNDRKFEIHTNDMSSSLALTNSLVSTVNNYNLSLSPIVHNPGISVSDHSLFWAQNYGAVLIIELYTGGDVNPYNHTSRDRIGLFNLSYFNELAKLGIGTLATLAKLTPCAPVFSGDYHSAVTGNWNSIGTWKTYNGSSWVAASTTPTNSDGKIIINYGHIITVTEDVSVDQVDIASGGQVSVAPGITLIIKDGSDEDDFSVNGNGKLYNAGTITSEGKLAFNGESIYEHAQNGGFIPVATWAVTSNCTITGITNSVPQIPSASQSFGNFTWNCASQSSNIDLSGQLTSIKGNFKISSTNNSSNNHALLLSSGTTGSLTVFGNFTQTGPSSFFITNGSSPGVMTVTDFTLASGNLYISGSTGAGTINVKGNCFITSGILTMSGSNVVGTLNIDGNFSQTGATITETSTGSGSINFNGTTMQTYTSGGRINNTINFNVNSGASLQMASAGTQVLGAGSFNLSPGGTLGITSPYGITSTGTAINPGNIAVGGTRNYSTGANYKYNGTADQSTGTGFPTSLTGKLIISNNGKIVTLNNTRTISGGGSINLVSGVLAAGSNLTMESGSTINRSGGSITGLITGIYNMNYSGGSMSTSTELSGLGLNNVTVDLIAGQTLTLDQNITPNGNLIITSGIFDLNMHTFNRSTPGGTLTISNGATLKIGGNGSMPTSFTTHNLEPVSTVEYSGANQTVSSETYGNLTLSGTQTKTIAAGTAVTVVTALTTNDQLTIESSGVSSSGSLIVSETGSSVGAVTYNRQMPTSLYRYISSPVSSASLPSGQTYWRWDEPTGDWIGTSSCTEGLGYTMLASGNPVSFTGTVIKSTSLKGTAPYNDPSYTQVRDPWGGGGCNLLGNPFTSAMNASSFIGSNTGSLDASYQALYIYDGANYKYAAASIPGYTIGGEFGDYVQTGEGFFVLAKQNNVTFNFTSAMQTHNTSVPMTKSARIPWPGVQLKVKYGNNESSTLLIYNEEMSTGLDPGYDVGLLSACPDVEIYTTLALKDNSVNFARQALPLAGIDTIAVAVGIDSEKGGEVTFSGYTVPFRNYKFWLEDRKNGTFTNLGTGAYTVTLPGKTYGTGQFFMIATTNAPNGIGHHQTEETDIRIWTSNDKVIINGNVSDKVICKVYDLNGRKIVDTRLSDGALNTVDMPSESKGVFIVRVTDGIKIFTKKVVFL
ncbi:MAG: M28 family peptidase [Bacteroidia bacterium]|nr:M28 family peptidase [Bacteroidia bacterium]